MKRHDIGRLMFREEGDNWVAYWAPRHDSMEDATILGSIRMTLVEDREERKRQFLELMQDCFSDVVHLQTGVRPIFGEPEPGPESERAGNA